MSQTQNDIQTPFCHPEKLKGSKAHSRTKQLTFSHVFTANENNGKFIFSSQVRMTIKGV